MKNDWKLKATAGWPLVDGVDLKTLRGDITWNETMKKNVLSRLRTREKAW